MALKKASSGVAISLMWATEPPKILPARRYEQYENRLQAQFYPGGAIATIRKFSKFTG